MATPNDAAGKDSSRQKATSHEMVTCKDFLRELSEFLDETVEPGTRAELEEHINGCPNCWVVCDTTRKTIQVYKGMEPQAISEQMHTKLISAIRRRSESKGHICEEHDHS